MTMTRSTILGFLLTLTVLWTTSPVRADEAFQRFLPLFIDLDGWQGKKADGMSMEMTNTSFTTANRDYQRDSAQAHASIMTGQSAMGALAPLKSGMNVTTSQGHMVSAMMHGMEVLKTYTASQKSGALLVALDKDAMFSFSYSGITENEALALAEKFDWNAMRVAAQRK